MHPKGANSMAASGLDCRKGLAVERPWLELGKPFLLLWMNQARKQSSGLVGPAFLTMTLFLSLHGWSLAENCE